MLAGVGPLTSVCRTGDKDRDRASGATVIRSSKGRGGRTAESKGFLGRVGPVGTGTSLIGWPT
jgi:hypothetical protein